jgi:hypothetical protein
LIVSGFQSRLSYRFGTDEVFADDEEYSVISEPALRTCRLVDARCEGTTGFACAYFEGALDEAPASAQSNASVDPQTKMSAPTMVTRHLDMASSIWFGTTQTKQNCRFRRRLLSRQPRMISSRAKRNHQSSVAGKISRSIYRPKNQQRLCRDAIISSATISVSPRPSSPCCKAYNRGEAGRLRGQVHAAMTTSGIASAIHDRPHQMLL